MSSLGSLLAEDGSVIEVGIDSDNISDVEIDIDAELADTTVSSSTYPDTLRNLESLINYIDC